MALQSLTFSPAKIWAREKDLVKCWPAVAQILSRSSAPFVICDHAGRFNAPPQKDSRNLPISRGSPETVGRSDGYRSA
jgi:hypothetical protein